MQDGYGDTPPPRGSNSLVPVDLRRLICAACYRGCELHTLPLARAAIRSRTLRSPSRCAASRVCVLACGLSYLCAHAPSIRTSTRSLPLAPSPRSMYPPYVPSIRTLPFAPSTRTLFTRTLHSQHPPLAPSPHTLPSPIACSWSAPATRSAFTSLQTTFCWCSRSRGYM